VVPGGDGQELEQRPVTTRIAVGELRRLLVPVDLEHPLFDAVVEPCTSEDELPQPVHERLAARQRDVLPVPHQIAAETAARVRDAAVRSELDQVGRLLVVQVVVPDETERYCRGGYPLLEVDGVESEAVTQELDDVVVARAVVRLTHVREDNLTP